MTTSNIKMSIVVPIYYNELNIPHTVPRLQALQDIMQNVVFEFIFVDDGSKDNSFSLLKAEKEKDQRIKIVKLSRNFGSMNAIQAGLMHATGDVIGIISADLQDPPEMFKDMLEKWQDGNKVVMAIRSDREESFSQKAFSNTYYYLFEKFALKDYPRGGFDFVLIDKQVAKEVINVNEKNTNIMGLIYWMGYDRESISYVRQERKLGKSRWTFSKKIKLFIDSFVSFSFMPIKFMSTVGFITAILSVFYGIFVILCNITGLIDMEGWTTIIALITFLLGIIMVMLGIIGEYLWRILDESRHRPPYVIDEVIE